MDKWLADHLVCPLDQQPVEWKSNRLTCPLRHSYPCVDDIPVMMVLDDGAEYGAWLEKFEHTTTVLPTTSAGASGVDPFVQTHIAATNGVMYRPLVGKLTRYPIPDFAMEYGDGRRLLDVGCNWGRWSLSAARRGYMPVGIDPSLDAVRAATRVARQLGLPASYVVADARQLPFANRSFDAAFSYSVLQHLEKPEARKSFVEIARVLKPGGASLIQLANISGLWSLQHRLRRAFRPRSPFDVNYYTVPELHELFAAVIGPTTIGVDGYFCLDPQPSDLDLLLPLYRAVVRTSAWLQRLSRVMPWMRYFADSVYVSSVRGPEMATHAPAANSVPALNEGEG